MTTPVVILLAISLAAALAYGLVWHGRAPSSPRTVVKTAAIGALALTSFAMGGPWLLSAALGLSALGDAFISRDGERMFMAGLVSFLLAHVAYVILMLGVGVGYDTPRLFAVALFAAYAVAITRWLWPHLSEMRGPVAAYILVIFCMGAAALGAAPAQWPMIAGAVLFMISDSVLAAETFAFTERPRRWTAPTVWWSYYPAQVLIAAAFLCPAFAP